MQNVRDYITWLLKDTPGWTRDKIDEAIASGQRIDVKLAQSVPVYWSISSSVKIIDTTGRWPESS